MSRTCQNQLSPSASDLPGSLNFRHVKGAIARGPLRGGSALCAGLAAYHEDEPGKRSAPPQLDAICKCLPAMRPIIVGWTVQNIFVDPASK